MTTALLIALFVKYRKQIANYCRKAITAIRTYRRRRWEEKMNDAYESHVDWPLEWRTLNKTN